LFNVQPGDEFGYQEYDLGMTPIRCFDNKMLRRILSRRLTADSLVVTYQEQRRHEEFGWAGYCFSPAGVTYSSITVNQWRLARAGNQWLPTGSVVQLAALRLLTGEYIAERASSSGFSPYLLVGQPIGSGGGFSSCPANSVSFVPYYLQNGTPLPSYRTGLDYAAWQYSFGRGAAIMVEGAGFMGQIYSRRNVNGTTQICGSPLAFVNLLPTRAAEAAALATLHPNPAIEAATLTLAQPARASHSLRLTDALGRTVWSAPLTIGQTTATVPLAGQPAGLYLLHLNGPGTAVSWKITHE
jgi:hypothetical protein